MRIPSGKTDQAIYFVAVDSTDLKTRKTGLSSFTVYRSRNGGTATVYTTPTITELSAANMPGVYSLLIDEDTTIASTSDAEEYCVHITQASMAPVSRVIELFRRDTTSGTTALVDANGRVDVIKIAGTTQTARDIGASVLLSSGTGTGQVSLAAGIAAVNVTQFGGAAGTFSGGRPEVNTTHAAGTAWNSGAITANTFAAGCITAAKFAANALDAVWSTATRVLTAGTNIVLAKGTGVTGFNDLDAAGVRGAVGMASANLDTQLSTLSGNDTTINNNLLAVNTKLGAPAGVSVSADIAAIKSDTGAIKAKTDNLPAAPAAVGDIPTANQNADALLDRASGVEAGMTPRQGFRLWSAALLGKANGLGTGTAIFRDTNDTKDRINASVDQDGNRLAVILDPS
ncbi:hypothetical protein EN858_17510 [Mesorhizobium sp. M4B.F.Ca.ET.215.01.1.1]|uniref:hypothetical protein n=1 Tax=unclassified Mesorhizobium TaxID=325217 RepID=UPI001093AEF3|nr:MULTISPECIES: hypothetical protein [unclassified Mesorhizobium]TGQ10209.1 hypothetical protein EN858_17510 [Mesorhizobium sp. M4B.F.Ca.ET.215.01.1.1]TGQ34046.1 hypothetical protein EN863_033680 [Mesorhizobium sp. M00.F.Ca.ET.220.01.1.1]TGR02748.1 hypothetical protein EN846_16960 [Mesorhizobium sp. M4B.F.Ca.ET.203.01.1.1]